MVSSTVRIHNFFADFKGKFFAITSIYEHLQHITKNYFQDFLSMPPVFPLPPYCGGGREDVWNAERRVRGMRGRGQTAIHPSFHRPPIFPPPPGDRYMVPCRNPAIPHRPAPAVVLYRLPPGARNCPINDTKSPQSIGIAGFIVNMQLNLLFPSPAAAPVVPQ